jgi:hypothetical protein
MTLFVDAFGIPDHLVAAPIAGDWETYNARDNRGELAPPWDPSLATHRSAHGDLGDEPNAPAGFSHGTPGGPAFTLQ